MPEEEPPRHGGKSKKGNKRPKDQEPLEEEATDIAEGIDAGDNDDGEVEDEIEHDEVGWQA